MKHVRSTISRLSGAVLAAALLAGTPGQPSVARADELLAQGTPDCFAIGQQVAAQEGGTLAGAKAETRGGQTVCRVVVLLPARDGERPRRVETIVPAQ